MKNTFKTKKQQLVELCRVACLMIFSSPTKAVLTPGRGLRRVAGTSPRAQYLHARAREVDRRATALAAGKRCD